MLLLFHLFHWMGSMKDVIKLWLLLLLFTTLSARRWICQIQFYFSIHEETHVFVHKILLIITTSCVRPFRFIHSSCQNAFGLKAMISFAFWMSRARTHLHSHQKSIYFDLIFRRFFLLLIDNIFIQGNAFVWFFKENHFRNMNST